MFLYTSGGGDGFSHEMGFDSVASPDPVASVGICISAATQKMGSPSSMKFPPTNVVTLDGPFSAMTKSLHLVQMGRRLFTEIL